MELHLIRYDALWEREPMTKINVDNILEWRLSTHTSLPN